MIHVIAILTAQPGQRAAMLDAFHANMPAVHAEAGCIEYGPVTDAPDFGRIQTKLGDDSFMVIEKWESADAVKAHSASPHMAEYAKKTGPMLASRVIHVLTDA